MATAVIFPKTRANRNHPVLVQPILDALRLRPFKPFSIRTAPGYSYPVNHPELVGKTASGNTLLIGIGGESVAMIEVASVAEIVYDNRPPTAVESL